MPTHSSIKTQPFTDSSISAYYKGQTELGYLGNVEKLTTEEPGKRGQSKHMTPWEFSHGFRCLEH